MADTCLVCGEPVTLHSPAALICGDCELEPLQSLLHRGFEFSFEFFPKSDSEPVRIHLTAPEEVSSGVAAVLGPEKLRHKFVKLFKREMQVGEASFDDAVFIHYAEDEDRVVFEDAVVQECVRLLVGACTVELMANTVLLRVRAMRGSAEDQLALLGGALLLAAARVQANRSMF